MGVGAIVLNWKDARSTKRCVDSLLADPLISSIVVVDNESDGSLASQLDTSTGQLSVAPLTENRGFSGGVNAGLARLVSDVDYVLIINNDAVLLPDSLLRLVEALDADTSVALAGPVLVNPDGSIQSSGGRVRFPARVLQRKGWGGFDYISWACVLLRSEAVRDAGPLDERFFMYWEDVEYSRRLTHRGWRISVVREAQVEHELSGSGARVGDRLRRYYSHGLVTMAFAAGPTWWARSLLGVLLLIIKRVVRGDVRGAGAVLRGARDAVPPSKPAYRSRIVE